MSAAASPALFASFSGVKEGELHVDKRVFHGPAGEWAEAVSPFTEAARVGIAVSYLVAFGNAVGRAPYVAVGPTQHHTNEFALLVGPTSSGRKGEAMNTGLLPLRRADEEWAKRVKRGFGSGEAIIATLAPREESEQSAVSHDVRLLVHEGEFAQVMAVAAREGSTLSSLLRAAWDGLGLENHTRTHGDLEAPDAHLSLLAGITKEELADRVTDTDIANGFLNRFLLVVVRREQLLPDPPHLPPGLVGPHVQAVEAALAHARQWGADLRRNDEARERWIDAYERELSVDRAGLAGAVCSRAEAHTLRLSMLYALLDRSKVIKVEHVEAALALWRYCEQSAIAIFGAHSGDPDREALIQALTAAGEEGLTRAEISKGVFKGHRPSFELNRLLGDAEHNGLVTSEMQATGGRSALRYWSAPFGRIRLVRRLAQQGETWSNVQSQLPLELDSDESQRLVDLWLETATDGSRSG